MEIFDGPNSREDDIIKCFIFQRHYYILFVIARVLVPRKNLTEKTYTTADQYCISFRHILFYPIKTKLLLKGGPSYLAGRPDSLDPSTLNKIFIHIQPQKANPAPTKEQTKIFSKQLQGQRPKRLLKMLPVYPTQCAETRYLSPIM